MKNINATNTNMLDPETYCEAIKTYDSVFARAFECAKELTGHLPDTIVARFMKQYKERTGWTAEIESTKAGIVDVLAAKILAKETGDSNITKWQHDLWSWHRIKEGWAYGLVKDKIAKTNPCLKHFSLLTEEEVAWDRMFAELYNETIGDAIHFCF